MPLFKNFFVQFGSLVQKVVLFQGAIAFLISLKGAIWKKKFWKPFCRGTKQYITKLNNKTIYRQWLKTIEKNQAM